MCRGCRIRARTVGIAGKLAAFDLGRRRTRPEMGAGRSALETAVEAACFWNGRNVPGAAVPPDSVSGIKKAPDLSGAIVWIFCVRANSGSTYFFFLAGAFLAAFFAAFLVAFFIESILPKRKICDPERSQRDSYIRWPAREVKKKMQKANVMRRDGRWMSGRASAEIVLRSDKGHARLE